jgi:hypothetical protein
MRKDALSAGAVPTSQLAVGPGWNGIRSSSTEPPRQLKTLAGESGRGWRMTRGSLLFNQLADVRLFIGIAFARQASSNCRQADNPIYAGGPISRITPKKEHNQPLKIT